MKLTNIRSNMVELEIAGNKILFSYNTPVAAIIHGGDRIVKTNKKWSATTTRHINEWLALLDQQGIGDTSAIPVDQSILDSLISDNGGVKSQIKLNDAILKSRGVS